MRERERKRERLLRASWVPCLFEQDGEFSPPPPPKPKKERPAPSVCLAPPTRSFSPPPANKTQTHKRCGGRLSAALAARPERRRGRGFRGRLEELLPWISDALGAEVAEAEFPKPPRCTLSARGPEGSEGGGVGWGARLIVGTPKMAQGFLCLQNQAGNDGPTRRTRRDTYGLIGRVLLRLLFLGPPPPPKRKKEKTTQKVSVLHSRLWDHDRET